MHLLTDLVSSVSPVDGGAVSYASLLVGLPLVDAFSPLWALTLPGTAAVVRLDTAPSPVLATVCDDLECRLLSASDLVPDFDEIEPSHVATLLRLAIEQASNS